MNFWRRALKSITRRKGKSVILFLVIFILGNVIAGAVAIQQSTVNVEKATKAKMGAKVTLDVDYEAFNKDQEKNEKLEWPDPLTEKQYTEIGNLSQVKYFDLSTAGYVGTNKLKSYTPENGGGVVGLGAQYFFNLKGTNSEKIIDLEEGFIKLDQGEAFTAKELTEGANVVLIAKEVADANNLKVGDQMVIDVTSEVIDLADEIEAREDVAETADSATVVTSDGDPEAKIASFDFPVTVKGIYSVVRKDTSQMSREEKDNAEWMAAEQINTMYLPNKTIEGLMVQSAEKFYVNVPADQQDELQLSYTNGNYVLKSPDVVDDFRQDAQAILPQYYMVVADADQYDQVAGGMKKLGDISKYVVIIAAVATMLIISLVVLLFLRDRKHELGIYLSLGESRGKVIGQIVVELLLVSFVALGLSLITGNLLGAAVSNSLMQMDWLNNATDSMMYTSSYGNNTLTFEDVRAAYQVRFTPSYIISYLILGLGTVLLSAILPLLYILRLNPKKIMM